MAYSEKVIDHYENPRNVGSMDKDDSNIGTGMVGAPACFVGATLISTPEGNGAISLKDMYDNDTTMHVWSFNIETHQYELKLAKSVKTGNKPVVNLTMDDGAVITCTADHKFLKITEEYDDCVNLIGASLKTYPDENDTPNHTIDKIEGGGVEDVFCLQVEENNNFIVLTNAPSGFVVKNCGDVMRLQIQVSEEGVIEDAKFKTYGCGSAIASSSLLTEWVKGKTLDEAGAITNVQIVEELELPPVKIHCSVLAEDAIKAAIEDYKSKQ